MTGLKKKIFFKKKRWFPTLPLVTCLTSYCILILYKLLRKAARPAHLTSKLCYFFNLGFFHFHVIHTPCPQIILKVYLAIKLICNIFGLQCRIHEILQKFWSWSWTGQLVKGWPMAVRMAEYSVTKQGICIIRHWN